MNQTGLALSTQPRAIGPQSNFWSGCTHPFFIIHNSAGSGESAARPMRSKCDEETEASLCSNVDDVDIAARYKRLCLHPAIHLLCRRLVSHVQHIWPGCRLSNFP